MTTHSDTAQLRRWIYHLLIAIAFAIACGRIASVQRVYEPAFHRDPAKERDRRPVWPAARPDSNAMFGSNDRARFATMRALVHNHTYVIGKREPDVVWKSAVAMLAATNGVEGAALAQAGYGVRTDVANSRVHHGIIFKEDFKEHGWATIDRVMNPETFEFYSSKPPLLATLLTGLYWIIFNVTGLSLIDQPTIVVRIVLFLINALPFAGYLWLLTQIAERWGKADWGRLYIVAAGAFATIVSPFLITLQNHTFGTFAVMLAWWSLLCVWDKISKNETPAWPHFVSAGFFSAFAAACEMPALAFTGAAFVLFLWWDPRRTLLLFLPTALVPAVAFFATNYIERGQLQPAQSEFGNAWYEYEGSHWKPPPEEMKMTKTGIDWARYHETRGQYALHVLVGHHGLFTLTPIWLLALAAMIAGSWRIARLWRQAFFRESSDFPWFVQPLGLALTVVVIGFYFSVESRNYGGYTNGLRWLMWLTPIWLTCLLPMADRLAGSKLGRCVGVVCLAISVFSVSYQLWSPWLHPWMFDLMLELGWKGY